MTTITFLAGATKRIQVYNSVLVLPYRDPVILAKQMATLDFLSGGRSILGIGIGHLEKEFEVLKVPRAERGPMSDEYLEAIKILWTEERPEFHGKYVEFDDIVFEPRPVAKPHPPIWIGGNTKPAMRRAAKYGDGWVPWQITPAQLPDALDYLKSRPEFAERPRPFDVVMPAVFIQREEGTQRELGETRIPDSAQEWLEAVGANRDAGGHRYQPLARPHQDRRPLHREAALVRGGSHRPLARVDGGVGTTPSRPPRATYHAWQQPH